MARPPRLPHYDYSATGAYFITLVTKERAPLLGSIDQEAGSIALSAAGRMVDQWWAELPRKFPALVLDARVIMPNHFHGLLLINGDVGSNPRSLSRVVLWFKTMTTAAYFRGVREGRWRPVKGGFWQHGFHDRIVRGAEEFERIRRYVERNPGSLWEITHP
jgi:REP element-mobilizing transposase RayT